MYYEEPIQTQLSILIDRNDTTSSNMRNPSCSHHTKKDTNIANPFGSEKSLADFHINNTNQHGSSYPACSYVSQPYPKSDVYKKSKALSTANNDQELTT